MKLYFFLYIIVFIFICSCKNTRLNINEQDKDIFNSVLKKEILRMIEVKNKNKDFNSKICNVVVLQDGEGDKNCIVMIGLGTNIVQPTVRFVPPSDLLESQTNSNTTVVGYAFLENELIGCAILSDLCNDGLINEKGLISIKDSISDYPHALHCDSDLNYDAPMKMYRVVSTDSLELINSFFMP